MQLEALRKIEKVLADEQYYLSRFYQHIRSMKSSWAVEYRNELSKRYGASIVSSGFGY